MLINMQYIFYRQEPEKAMQRIQPQRKDHRLRLHHQPVHDIKIVVVAREVMAHHL